MPDLADAEVICGFLERMPPLPDYYHTHLYPSPEKWWVLGPVNGGGMRWYPCTLDLDALWLVEQKLIAVGLDPRIDGLYRRVYGSSRTWHLTAAQKVEALAGAIRGIK